MERAGFRCRNAAGIHVFVDGSEGKFRDAVHVLFADEKVRPEYADPAPRVDESEPGEGNTRCSRSIRSCGYCSPPSRPSDRVHLRDMLDVGLIDAGWLSRSPPQLAARLQQLLDDPDG